MHKPTPVKFVIAAALVSASWAEAQSCKPPPPTFAPTEGSKTFIRKNEGQFGSSRQGGAATHTGTDLVTRAGYSDQKSYAVGAVAAGSVAYSRINGLPGQGYGNMIVIDHGNGCYSLYAHLASDPFTPMNPGGTLLKNVGDKVKAGELIGYFVKLKADVDSSGNAMDHPVAPHQVHFGLIAAPSGRSGTGALADSIMKSGASYVNPESLLRDLGYRIE